MVAYDSRRWPDPANRLSDETLDLLRTALNAQREVGSQPRPELKAAIHAAAAEARERAIPPETLLIQLKLLAEDLGLPPVLGDDASNALRKWIVSVCVAAYFATDGG